MQHVPIQMCVLRLAQLCVHRAGRIGDSARVQNAEAFAVEVFFEVVLGDKIGGLPADRWMDVGVGGCGGMSEKGDDIWVKRMINT